MTRRHPPQQEEPIADELLEKIPLVDGDRTTLFETLDEDDVPMAGPVPDLRPRQAPAPAARAEPPASASSSELASQLRSQMGDAFAAELDRAEQLIASTVAALEQELARERAARKAAEARLAEFRRLALG